MTEDYYDFETEFGFRITNPYEPESYNIPTIRTLQDTQVGKTRTKLSVEDSTGQGYRLIYDGFYETVMFARGAISGEIERRDY